MVFFKLYRELIIFIDLIFIGLIDIMDIMPRQISKETIAKQNKKKEQSCVGCS